jgi:hypothetical protein
VKTGISGATVDVSAAELELASSESTFCASSANALPARTAAEKATAAALNRILTVSLLTSYCSLENVT